MYCSIVDKLVVDPRDSDEFKNLPVDELPEPPVSVNWVKREVLATIKQTAGKDPTVIEVIRYTWSPKIADEAGYPSCVRFRRKYQHPTRSHHGSESVGVPETDFKAFVEALMKVKI